MIKIFESRKDFGTMNGGTVRFSNLTAEDKKLLSELHNIDVEDLETYDLSRDKGKIFSLHRKELGESMGFDGHKMFMADQKNKTGTHLEITKDYVEANPKGWTDIDEDILVVTSKTPGVVIGHPVADCPVVMMSDKRQGITAIGHCSGEMIDRRLPMMIASVLRGAYGSQADDIFAYVSASAGDSWTYDGFPKWAKDMGVWNRCIISGDDDKFHINLKPAVLLQIIAMGIKAENIKFNMDDTITNENYFSNNASSINGLNQPEKFGRNFAGMFYTGEDDSKVEIHKGK